MANLVIERPYLQKEAPKVKEEIVSQSISVIDD